MPDLPDVRRRWQSIGRSWPIVAAASFGLVSAIVAWLAVSAWEERLAKAKFYNIAGDYAQTLQNGLDDYLRKLLAVRALYEASIDIDANEFAVFTDQILAGQTEKMRVIWCPYVTRAERAAFEREQIEAGLADYAIKSWRASGTPPLSPERDEYFPVLYSTFASKATATFGMDLNSEPVRSRAIQYARDNDVVATAQDVMLRNPIAGSRLGFIYIAPVYRVGVPLDTQEQRHDNIRGVLVASFQTKAVIDSILAKAALPQSVSIYVYRSDDGAHAMPIYWRAAVGADQPVAAKSLAELAGLNYWSGPVKAGNANWKLVVVPEQEGLISYYRAWLAFFAVLFVFSAVVAYMWASLRHALRLESANSRILTLAQTDLLTDLANRRAFMKRLTAAFNASARGAPPFAVLYLDIDDFKDVNDTLGHAMGDLLLKQVVERLKTLVGSGHFVARFGGDEFAILVCDVRDPHVVGELAARIRKSLGEPFTIDHHRLRITSSIGISVYSSDLSGPEDMLVQADLALYGAKDEGRNCYRFHSRDLDRKVHERVRVADELRAALEHRELELYYQPQVALATGRIMGLEALIRWNHKTRGLLTPAAFIPIAERTGAALAIGSWVFEEACRQLKLWHVEGIAPQVLAVNVSGVQLKGSAELEREVAGALTRFGIDPGRLELELTESVLMEATQRHKTTLENLRQLGTKIAIDDFGTGYSSLKYLTTYPVNRLKLAQEFVFRVTVDYRNAAVVRAAIRLAHELGLEVIAEGVETEAQMRFLIGAGCEHAQGYYFSRPVTAERTTELLREGVIRPEAGELRRTKTNVA
ncbi:bifunctional diguanylate cyclase/phosphodiesterase [Methyloceanibacter sp.]|uniref:bifunctional diguanylate cyclase/phosphodiesterase n=1 Tax=Methyloceanibacter sp. TaxID=1965321 RepID=UPI002D581712|nr:EAL domain-containing protein [Methyloceanibacter sp.]HZP09087.1 EAL domain-containing protein [Methyloceanibacter sp.]